MEQQHNNNEQAMADHGEAMDFLWKRLTSFYGRQFLDFFPSANIMAEAKQAWTEETFRRGLTKEMIRKGLDTCIDERKQWPPSMPEFIEMCERKPEVKPDCRQIYISPPKDENALSQAQIAAHLQKLTEQLTKATKDARKD